MPYLRIDCVGPLDSDVKQRLLAETGQLFAELIGSDVSRVRVLVHEFPHDSFAVGGVPVTETGIQAPYITLDLFEGRPDSQHAALCEQIPRLVADVLDCPLDGIRLRINEVFPGGWSIGGVQASEKQRRAAEARAEQRQQQQQQQE